MVLEHKDSQIGNSLMLNTFNISHTIQAYQKLFMMSLLKKDKNLKTVNIDCRYLNEPEIAECQNLFEKIEALCFTQIIDLHFSSIILQLVNTHHLKVLKLKNFQTISIAEITSLFEILSGKSVRELEIEIPFVTSVDGHLSSQSEFFQELGRIGSLKHLSLHMALSNPTWCSSFADGILKKIPNLKTLRIKNSSNRS